MTGHDIIQAITYWGLENCEVDPITRLDTLIFGVREISSEECTYYFDIEVPAKKPENGYLHIWSMKKYEEYHRLKDIDDIKTFIQDKVQEVTKSIQETGEWRGIHEHEED